MAGRCRRNQSRKSGNGRRTRHADCASPPPQSAVAAAYRGALMTTKVVAEPDSCGWYQVLPHCWYAKPLTITVPQLGGNVFTIDPITAAVTMAVAVTAAAVATGW